METKPANSPEIPIFFFALQCRYLVIFTTPIPVNEPQTSRLGLLGGEYLLLE
jgi:hypothetical protein